MFRSPEFRLQYAEWSEKLKSSGFEDIETSRGNIKNPDIRTIAFQNQDKIRDFFLRLDQLLGVYDTMPKDERAVMELYTEGVFICEIVEKTLFSYKKCQLIIKRYQGLILAIDRMLE